MRTSLDWDRSLLGLAQLGIYQVLENGPRHPYEIAQQLQGAGFSVNVNWVYGVLFAATRAGRVAVVRREDSERGPSRKIFDLTADGRSSLAEGKERLSVLIDSLDRLRS